MSNVSGQQDQAYENGYSAAKAMDVQFMPELKNPYPKDTQNHKSWANGWGDYFRRQRNKNV